MAKGKVQVDSDELREHSQKYSEEAEADDVNIDHGDFSIKVGPPQLRRTPRFVFMYDPRAWEVLDGALVPQLTKFKIASGLNGISDESYYIAQLTEHCQKHGRIAIPMNSRPGGRSYVKKFRGTEHHQAFWVSAFADSQELSSDEEKKVEWLKWLRETKVIPQPAVAILRNLLSTTISAHAKAVDRAAKEPSQAAIAATLLRNIELLRGELEAAKTDKRPLDAGRRAPADEVAA